MRIWNDFNRKWIGLFGCASSPLWDKHNLRQLSCPFLVLLGCIVVLVIPASLTAQNTIWQIGDDAGTWRLYQGVTGSFLQNDFGWEDRYFLVGYSDLKKDWSYVLPGPLSTMCGHSNLSFLVEGDRIELLVDGDSFFFAYAGTFAIPAAVQDYTIRNRSGTPAMVIKAFIK